MISLGLGSIGLAKVNLLSFKSINATFSNPSFEYSAPHGLDRILLVTVVSEFSNSVDYNITSITYGGIEMLKIGESGSSSLISRNEIESYYLLDSSISRAVDSTIIITYDKSSMSSLDEVIYTAITFENVEQNFPIFSFSKNALTSASSISTDQITTDPQDGVISILNSSNNDITFSSCSSFTSVEQTSGSTLSKGLDWSAFRIDDSFTPKYTAASVAGRVSMMTFGVKASLGAPLPVKLTHFDARLKSDKTAVLNWITQSEQNSDYFIVEKSTDFRNWETIETVVAAGNSNARKTYNANDYNMTAGITYYRLTQVDFDGESKTYDPVSVELTIENTLSIYPNPAQETLHISGLDWANQGAEISTIKGDVILARVVGNTVDVSNLSNGIYFLNLNNQTHKFVVAH
jgi:hypothetical protein